MCAAVGLTAPALAGTGTGMFQVDPAHSGYVYGAGVVPPLQREWTLPLAWSNAYTVTGAGRVFAFANTGGSNAPVDVDAIDLSTGRVEWSQPVGRASYAYQAVGGGLVFTAVDGVYPAGSSSAAIIISAFDERTGALAWSEPLEDQGFPTPPVFRDGVLYLDGDGIGGTEYAIRASDGKRLWTTPVEMGNPVTLAGNTLVTSSACGLAYGLDTSSGALLWRHSEDCYGGGTFMASFDGKHLWGDQPSEDAGGRVFDSSTGDVVRRFQGYAPSFGYGEAVQALRADTYSRLKLSAFDPDTMQVKWTFDEGDGSRPVEGSYPPLGTVPLLADGYVFAEGSMGELWALDPHTGSVVWHDDLAQRAPSLSYDPLPGLAAGDGYLVAPTETGITAFKGSGTPSAPPPDTGGGATAPPTPGAPGAPSGSTAPSAPGDGGASPGPASSVRPVISHVHAALLRAHTGARLKLTFRLDMPATVSISVPRAHLRLSRRERAGSARVLVRTKALRHGIYRARLVALSAAGARSRMRVARFAVR